MGSAKSGQKLGFKEESSKKLLTIDQWLSVFFIYTSVYLQRYPTESEPIVRYIETVRSQFRRLKKALGLSWDNNHQSLWLDARLDQINVYMHKQQAHSHIFVPNGYCQKYHLGQSDRYPCKYSHECFKCNLVHPATVSCHSITYSPMNAGGQTNRFSFPRVSGDARQQSVDQQQQQT